MIVVRPDAGGVSIRRPRFALCANQMDIPSDLSRRRVTYPR
jgi:hypothetical protein